MFQSCCALNGEVQWVRFARGGRSALKRSPSSPEPLRTFAQLHGGGADSPPHGGERIGVGHDSATLWDSALKYL